MYLSFFSIKYTVLASANAAVLVLSAPSRNIFNSELPLLVNMLNFKLILWLFNKSMLVNLKFSRLIAVYN